jgi:hypothetical protein
LGLHADRFSFNSKRTFVSFWSIRFLSRGVLACGDVPTLLKRNELYVEILGKLVRLNSSAEPSLPRFLLFNLLFLRRD